MGLELGLKKSLWRASSADARQLVRIWSQPHSAEADLARSTATFLHKIISAEPVPPPPWLKQIARKLAGDKRVATAALAAELGLHPAWLARAYRAAAGEGVQEAARRGRVGRAVQLLRRSDLALAQVAADCGFSDQSHMTRDFRIVLGRTPLQVRSERALLETSSTSFN
jgi:AraC-like DNA-binding protein